MSMTAPTPHRAAVEAAATALDNAMEGWGQRMAGEVYTPAAEAAIQAYRATMEAAGWRMVPRQISKEHRDRAWDAFPGHMFDCASWLYLYDAAPPPEGG